MLKHSKEVQNFRRELVNNIKSMDLEKCSTEDRIFLMSIIDKCISHLNRTAEGDEDGM